MKAHDATRWQIGSSPRGRGKPGGLVRGPHARRLIPAWAGKTRGSRVPQGQPRAHPRVGGENEPASDCQIPTPGSSPRGRGKQAGARPSRRTGRLIPAWAGKTPRPIRQRARSWAHPRVGGENRRSSQLSSRRSGSSPRGRGKPCHHWQLRRQPGLIPAWAGKTQEFNQAILDLGAHPRVGGENGVSDADSARRAGSSPRGRGKLGPPIGVGNGGGLIPAWAGKTRRRSPIARPPGAHPRVGGENQVPSSHRR